MTFLDKSNTMKDGLGGRSDAALRSVRTKREADEAGMPNIHDTLFELIVSQIRSTEKVFIISKRSESGGKRSFKGASWPVTTTLLMGISN
jgi:hypothetical protein